MEKKKVLLCLFNPTVYCVQKHKKEKGEKSLFFFLKVIYHKRSGYLNEAKKKKKTFEIDLSAKGTIILCKYNFLRWKHLK